MRRPRAWCAGAATVATALLVLTGCTGVPTSSAPQTIKPVSLGAAATSPAMSPAPGIEPGLLVYNFLTSNGIEPGRHASARTFLTPVARSRWTDTSATIISDETVGTVKPGSPQVAVRGRIVGLLSKEGIYTPSLGGTGNGAALTAFPFTVKKIDGQYRIDSLPKGLVLTTDQFQQTYKQHNLYFYDLAGRYLVPDVRWSGLQGTALEQWLVTQLAAGPSDELQNAVNSDTFPTQATQRTISIKRGTTTAVEIRGAQHLDSAGKDQLAAQVSYTLSDASAGDLLSITDDGKGVHIPAANSAEFTSSSFDRVAGPITPQPDVYYLRNGKIHTDNGRLLSGPVNNGDYYLNSIGLERTGSSPTLNVAGTVGTGSAAQLVVGTQRGGLHPVAVNGELSRPAWVPGSNEVWIGAGLTLWRTTLSTTGRPAKPTRIAIPPTAPRGAQIVALRLSPEGSRVAMVLELTNRAKQLFVGSVVRSAGQVRVDTLAQVSPEDVAVTDVAWIDQAKLFAVGHNTSSQDDPKVFETNVDGSLWSARRFTLPYPPDSVTFAVGQLAWVSSGGYVWVQNGPSDWQSPGAISQTLGIAPVYLE